MVLYGQTLCDMKEELFTTCGGTLTNVTDLTGVIARFLKFQVIEEYKALTICGLKLSGQEGKFSNCTKHLEHSAKINII